MVQLYIYYSKTCHIIVLLCLVKHAFNVNCCCASLIQCSDHQVCQMQAGQVIVGDYLFPWNPDQTHQRPKLHFSGQSLIQVALKMMQIKEH